MPHYVLDENNNRIEAYSAQEVLAVIEQAIADGSLANVVAGSAFVTKLKCCVSGKTNYVAFTTQATYNELVATGTAIPNCYYFIIDDTTAEDMASALATLQERVQGILDGDVNVSYAYGADQAAYANNAIYAERAGSFNETEVYTGGETIASDTEYTTILLNEEYTDGDRYRIYVSTGGYGELVFDALVKGSRHIFTAPQMVTNFAISVMTTYTLCLPVMQDVILNNAKAIYVAPVRAFGSGGTELSRQTTVVQKICKLA